MAAAAVTSVTEEYVKNIAYFASVKRMADETQQVNLWENRNVKVIRVNS